MLARATATVAVTLGAGAACWAVALERMRGMDMGVATDTGSLTSFVALWVPMMAAMMLPAAAPAVAAFVRRNGSTIAAPRFPVSYLLVWGLVGLAVYALYRPHGTTVAGLLTVAAGLYELAPLKRECRRRCRESVRSGFEFGRSCVGSSIGLMVILISLGIMSVTWMAVVAALVVVQKLLPPLPAVDVPVAIGIVGLGVLVAVAPSSVPGLVAGM